MIGENRGRGRFRQAEDLTEVSSKREIDRLNSRFTNLVNDIFTEKPRLDFKC